MAGRAVRSRGVKAATVAVANDSGDTRDRILDVAERLFAARGIENVTLRDITSEAGVNLAAIHYHLGSREELLRAIFVRRMMPLLEERLQRLRAMPDLSDTGAQVEHIVRAFVEPAMEYDCSTEDFLVHRLITRLTVYEVSNPVDVFDYVLRDCHDRFLEAFGRALPGLDRDQLAYRFEFMFGLVSHATALRAKLMAPDRENHGIGDPDRLVPELVMSIVAIFTAQEIDKN